MLLPARQRRGALRRCGLEMEMLRHCACWSAGVEERRRRKQSKKRRRGRLKKSADVNRKGLFPFLLLFLVVPRCLRGRLAVLLFRFATDSTCTCARPLHVREKESCDNDHETTVAFCVTLPTYLSSLHLPRLLSTLRACAAA